MEFLVCLSRLCLVFCRHHLGTRERLEIVLAGLRCLTFGLGVLNMSRYSTTVANVFREDRPLDSAMIRKYVLRRAKKTDKPPRQLAATLCQTPVALSFRSLSIQSFTNQGDTVMPLNAEADGVVECALNYGRKVEAFVATEGEHAGVNTRIENAWEAAWRQGKFSVSQSAETSFVVAWESCTSCC